MKKIIGVFLLVVLVVGFVSGLMCPDHQSQCPDTSTCCKMPEGYGCCPYVDATCCSDQSHCCPNGLTCDVVHARCISKTMIPYPFSNPTLSWDDLFGLTKKVDPLPQIENVNKVCPNVNQSCHQGSDTYPCCPMRSGHEILYLCCPIFEGICCSVGGLCCPKDTVCSPSTFGCDPVAA